MMTSTFPGSKTGSSQSLKGTIQEIQSKREALRSLEAALKRRISEFKELCLKEGEITGQLPGDYPLQPREPIPQVRRRTDRSNSNGNLNDASSISPAASVSSSHRIEAVQPQSAYAISSGGQVIFPPRPMSTNSTSSSISTASSNTRSINNQQHTNMLATPKISSSSSNGRLNAAYQTKRNLIIHNHHLPVQYDYSPMQTTRFKRPQELPNSNNFDNESSGLMRASSTASTSSSSGSAASSTLSTVTIPNTRLNNNGKMLNLHTRSCSESMEHSSVAFQPSKAFPRSQEALPQPQHHHDHHQQQQQQNQIKCSNKQLQQHSSGTHNMDTLQPVRPPRGLANGGPQQHVRKFDSVGEDLKSVAENQYQQPNQLTTKLSESSSLRALQHINIDGKGSFVPYYEETKPFQMSDFYKYSSKHRQKMVTSDDVNDPSATRTKTTRQLQEDVKKNSLRFSSCDDQKIQNSMRIIEKSGQKLIEATAKAIAVNPGLAEKINSILPNSTGDKY